MRVTCVTPKRGVGGSNPFWDAIDRPQALFGACGLFALQRRDLYVKVKPTKKSGGAAGIPAAPRDVAVSAAVFGILGVLRVFGVLGILRVVLRVLCVLGILGILVILVLHD